ncbi:MAG: hypothetical protein EXR52_06325 [Dehalococcoidia bacterium]|nr:hypothetical protein [Dehalococcoidia bacterium]
MSNYARGAFFLALALSLAGLGAPQSVRAGVADPIDVGGITSNHFPRAVEFEVHVMSAKGVITEAQLHFGVVSRAGTVDRSIRMPIQRGFVLYSHRHLTNAAAGGFSYRYYVSAADSLGNRITTQPREFTYRDTRFPWTAQVDGNLRVEAYGPGAYEAVKAARDSYASLGKVFKWSLHR